MISILRKKCPNRKKCRSDHELVVFYYKNNVKEDIVYEVLRLTIWSVRPQYIFNKRFI